MNLRELHNRLVVVEHQVSQLVEQSNDTRTLASLVDADIGEHQQMVRGHMRVLAAVRQTQIDHSEALAEQAVAIDDVRETQAEHGDMLRTQNTLLCTHDDVLHENQRVLDDLRKAQAEHGRALAALTEGQAALLHHFGIGDAGDDARSTA